MKSQDLMNNNNNRAFVIQKLIKLCANLDLSYDYNEKKFKITLPDTEEMPIINTWNGIKRGKLKDIDLSIFGKNTGYYEDELPPVDTKLEEGEAPDETTNL